MAYLVPARTRKSRTSIYSSAAPMGRDCGEAIYTYAMIGFIGTSKEQKRWCARGNGLNEKPKPMLGGMVVAVTVMIIIV
jgi:hypothetical protein